MGAGRSGSGEVSGGCICRDEGVERLARELEGACARPVRWFILSKVKYLTTVCPKASKSNQPSLRNY